MAAAGPAPGSWHLAHNAPAVVQWEGGRLGWQTPEQTCRVTADLGFDAAQHTALLRFRVPVALKEDARKKTVLYLFVDPSRIASLEPCALGDTPQPVLHAFIGQCDSSDDVVGLRVSLTQPPTVVGPTGTTSLSPRNRASGNVMEVLLPLSRAVDFCFYIPKDEIATGSLGELCKLACDGSLKPSAKEYALDMLYGGSGGSDVGSQLDNMQSPPSYDELDSSGPRKRKFRLPARHPSLLLTCYHPAGPPPSRDATPPAKKRGTVHDRLEAHLSAAMQPWRQKLEALTADLAMFRSEVAASPTEDGSVADRFDRIEDEVRTLRTQMESIEGSLNERLGALEERTKSWSTENLDELLDDRVDDRLDQMRDNIRADIDDQLDDKLTDWKVELQDWVADEMRGMVAEELRDILDGHVTLEASFDVHLNER